MEESLLFRVRPDGSGSRWTNIARLIGLVGIIVLGLAKFLSASMPTVSTILMVLGAVLGLGNLAWIYLLPSLVMLVLYTPAFAVVSVVNLLHILILQRNNDELVYFQAKYMNMRARIALSIYGLTPRVPHVDLYGSSLGSNLIELRFKTESEIQVRWVLLRLAILAALGVLFFLISLAVAHIPYARMVLGGIVGVVAGVIALSIPVIWIHNAITGSYITLLVDLHLRLMRVGLVVGAYFSFVTNDINEFKTCFRSVIDEELPPSLPEPKWLNPNDSRRLDINLIALVVLIVATSGLYLLIWLARIAKVMGDDPFTIIAVALLGGLLPLSVIFSRYYRRLEKKTGNDPSWILELLMVVPLLNLLVATFTIQYILNLTRKARPAS